jgi:hypothetical protein
MITALGVQEQTWLGEVLFYGYAGKKTWEETNYHSIFLCSLLRLARMCSSPGRTGTAPEGGIGCPWSQMAWWMMWTVVWKQHCINRNRELQRQENLCCSNKNWLQRMDALWAIITYSTFIALQDRR